MPDNLPMQAHLTGYTSVWLDAIRGISAQLVVVGHALMVLLVAGRIDSDARAALTMGSVIASHAVVSFFVMSGYLVGGRVLLEFRAGHFVAPAYLRNRTVRLGLVLLPALLVTAAVDWATFNLGEGYRLLQTAVFPSNFLNTGPWDLTTVLANAAFLQTIIAPQFGTNFALWSISNEFWYYVALPCLCGAFVWRGWRQGAAASCILVMVFLIASKSAVAHVFLLFFAIWGAGAAAALLRGKAKRVAAAASLLGALILFARNGLPLSPIGTTIMALAVLGFVLFSEVIPAGWIAAPSRFLAKFSFSLYAIHFPALICLVSFDSALFSSVLEVKDLWRVPLYVIVASCLALCFWALTERHTASVRRFVSSLTLVFEQSLARR
jgi:peptidoglycan/LPS O-acetylase OafA/YrhL